MAIFLFAACQQRAKQQVSHTPNFSAASAKVLLEKASRFHQSGYDSLYFYSKQAYVAALSENNREAQADALAMQADYQRKKGNHPLAVSLNMQTQKIYDSLSIFKKIVKAQLSLADFYKEMGGERGTTVYLQQGLQLARNAFNLASKQNDFEGQISGLNIQGIILRDFYKKTKKSEYFDSAYACYRRALAIADQTGQGQEMYGKLYNNISQVFNEYFRDYDQALVYLKKAVSFNKQRGNINSLSFNYGNLAEVYLNRKDFGRARLYAWEMLAIANQLQAPHRKLNAYNMLVAIQKKTGRYDSALFFREKYIAVSDSLTNIQKTAQIAEMNTKFETEKNEARIENLKALNQSSAKRLWAVSSLALVILCFLFFSFYQNRKLKKQKAIIGHQSERLQWLMKELHHRVKNNLQVVSSLLNLQVYRTPDTETQAILKESQLRVKAMSLIHQRLYQVDDLNLVNIKLYLRDLITSLRQAYGYQEEEMQFIIDADEEYLDVDTVMPMGLLLNEVITNAFKHAFHKTEKPRLHLSLESTPGVLLLKIGDNGPGIGLSGKPAAGSFGKKLIDALASQLSASYDIDTSNGTTYRFSIPYQKNKAA